MLLWSVNTLSLFPFLGFFGRSERHKKESEAHDSLAKHRETQHTHFCCSKADLWLSPSPKSKSNWFLRKIGTFPGKERGQKTQWSKHAQYNMKAISLFSDSRISSSTWAFCDLPCVGSFYTLRSRHPTHHGSITGKDIATDMKWGIRQQ